VPPREPHPIMATLIFSILGDTKLPRYFAPDGREGAEVEVLAMTLVAASPAPAAPKVFRKFRLEFDGVFIVSLIESALQA